MKYGWLVLLFLLPARSVAQEKPAKIPLFQELGFWPGFGYSVGIKHASRMNYRPYFAVFHLAMKPLLGRYISMRPFQFYLEPRYNLLTVSKPHQFYVEHEVGLHAGLKYTYPVLKDLALFAHFSAGPLVNAGSSFQERKTWLTFHYGAGLYRYFSKKWAGVIGFRVRYISQSGSNAPAYVIHPGDVHLGISYFFSKKEKSSLGHD